MQVWAKVGRGISPPPPSFPLESMVPVTHHLVPPCPEPGRASSLLESVRRLGGRGQGPGVSSSIFFPTLSACRVRYQARMDGWFGYPRARCAHKRDLFPGSRLFT